MLDQILMNLCCIFVGLFLGEHLRTLPQILIFLPSAALLLIAQYMRWINAREALRKAMAKYKEATGKDFVG